MAFAGAVSAGVHHDDAVTGAKQELRLADDADAIIGDAVKEENPISVGIRRRDFPAAEHYAVGSADVEVFAVATGIGDGSVGFADEVGGEFAADGMEEGRGDEPAGDACQEWRKEKKDQQDADEAATSGGGHRLNEYKRKRSTLFGAVAEQCQGCARSVPRSIASVTPPFSVSSDYKGLSLSVS